MSELLDLVNAWRAIPAGEEGVLVTVIDTAGSTYRKRGARMLVSGAGWVAGSISGGCLEADAIEMAFDRTESGPFVHTFDSTAENEVAWGYGLGCDGKVTVLMQRVRADTEIFRLMEAVLATGERQVVATVVSPGPRFGATVKFEIIFAPPQSRLGRPDFSPEIRQLGEELLFIEALRPPISLTIFGAGHDVPPLVRLAKTLGWKVVVVDHRSGLANRERFPTADEVHVLPPGKYPDSLLPGLGRAVVVMTHNYEADKAILGSVLPMPFSYVGQLGPAGRTSRMLTELGFEGPDKHRQAAATLHAPVGLKIHSEGPAEIALAIVAEIQSVLGLEREFPAESVPWVEARPKQPVGSSTREDA